MSSSKNVILALKNDLTSEEMGILLREDGISDKLQAKVLEGIDDGFYGRFIKFSQEIALEIQKAIDKQFDEDKSEEEIIIEMVRLILNVTKKMEAIEGYEKYEVLATAVYQDFGIDYNKAKKAKEKMATLLSDDDIVKKLCKIL